MRVRGPSEARVEGLTAELRDDPNDSKQNFGEARSRKVDELRSPSFSNSVERLVEGKKA
jgi:hypothetical protein